MPQPRRTAWALVATLFATTLFAVSPGLAFATRGPNTGVQTVVNPETVCAPTEMPTRWADELHPPQTVRVLRSKGPNAGDVEVVNFWKYVGRVVRAEYSSGSSKPYPWMHIGAITVKQYAWWKSMHWGGGRVTKTNPDSSTTVKCFDLKDTTADQIYIDLKADPLHPDPADPNHWMDANMPTAANLQAMRETWHMTIRKWQPSENKSRLFLSGYRSGKKKPCGADGTGFRIYQKSLRDCGTKNLTLEETMREYFEPNMLVVDTRDRDMQDDNQWFGDLGVLVPQGQSAAYKLFNGTATSFNTGANGTFTNVGTVLGQGVGNVDQPDTNGANDAKMLADLVMLVNDGGQRKLVTARAKATGLDTPTTKNLVGSPQQLLVADFDGDLFADAGVLSDAGAGNATLEVLKSKADGTWADAATWWTGQLDLDTDFVAAGDTNGDGKADLIMRSASAGTYSVAQSRASCSPMGAWGPCAGGSIGAQGLSDATAWLTPTPAPTWDAANVLNTVGDYDRDGRDDVMAVVKNGTGFKVYGLRAKTDATFADPLELYSPSSACQPGSGTPTCFAEVVPAAMNVNSDGMADLALMVKNGSTTNLVWLRSNERTAGPATMTMMQPALQTTLQWSAGNRLL